MVAGRGSLDRAALAANVPGGKTSIEPRTAEKPIPPALSIKRTRQGAANGGVPVWRASAPSAGSGVGLDRDHLRAGAK